MCDCDATGVKEDGVRAGGWIRVKRTDTMLRGSVRRLDHMLVSWRILESRSGCMTRVV